MKKTLIDKMQAYEGIPKSWVAELRTIEKKLIDAEEKIEEYGLIIDELARERDRAQPSSNR